MARITQNLFEEIEKITSSQIEEKLKHDEDGDGDEDAADYMMRRRKAGGQTHAQAHAATRKHNEETEQEGEELEEKKEELDEVLWPGTPEYNKRFPKDSKPGQRMSKQDYGYRGPSGSETEDKPSSEEGKEKGRGRRKIRSEETIVKHKDFTIDVVNNPTFKDFFNSAKLYVNNDDDAVTVAEAFFNDKDTSIIIESNITELYKNLLNKYEKDGYLIEDIDITIDEDEAYFKYTLVEKDSEIKRTYVHHGNLVVKETKE